MKLLLIALAWVAFEVLKAVLIAATNFALFSFEVLTPETPIAELGTAGVIVQMSSAFFAFLAIGWIGVTFDLGRRGLP